MKSITFTADESLIDAARAQARSDNTTLNEQFRLWLAEYAREQRIRDYEAAIGDLRGKVVVGRKLTRDEMNEGRLTEGLQHGQQIEGLVIEHPFRA
ncbi:hypothetical protein [Nevskia sp.]|uniref:hypothetical protein n=1 Tax=Nevskia sp. TaxID=1929292 RepID=UPI0025F23FFB|nr:hypothetical protein [Nevskia sp.]